MHDVLLCAGIMLAGWCCSWVLFAFSPTGEPVSW